MWSIFYKGHDVLVGDCYGVDASVQRFYYRLGYDRIIVYACNGKARNNMGHWQVKNITVPSYLRGFNFYEQKDVAMAKEADFGFMIWDGKSRGTLNNIVNLVEQRKGVLVYLVKEQRAIVVKTFSQLDDLISSCSPQSDLKTKLKANGATEQQQ